MRGHTVAVHCAMLLELGVSVMTRKWLSVKEVCDLLGVARQTVNRYSFDPEYAHLGFPKPFKLGFRVFYEAALIETWIEKQLPKR
jgi:predicted DNA-binding transcriptional regulator AlpA